MCALKRSRKLVGHAPLVNEPGDIRQPQSTGEGFERVAEPEVASRFTALIGRKTTEGQRP